MAEQFMLRFPPSPSSLDYDKLARVIGYLNCQYSRLWIDSFASYEVECKGNQRRTGVLDVPSMVKTVQDINGGQLAKCSFLFFGMLLSQICHSFGNFLQAIPFKRTNCDWL